MLKEVGFWAMPRAADAPASDQEALDHRPDPRDLVEEKWAAKLTPDERDRLEWYLTRGAFVESHELAYSFCRFDGCRDAQESPKVMGACTLTDGAYCWPEGFWHYVARHRVKPPSEFLAHIEARYDALVSARSGAGDDLLLWDELEGKPVAMPEGMKEWIKEYTTLGER